MIWSRLKRFLIGDPLSSDRIVHEKIPKWKALAVLSSDALSSVAYATEEVLIPLALFGATLGAVGVNETVLWSLPVGIAIVFLLIVITTSYQHTIAAYPGGGGAYIVAKENLGTIAGLVAGASLLIDYVLTVAVSVASGVENIVSAFPSLAGHKVLIDIFCIVIITLFNLRGVKESASIFALPTYFFIFSFLLMFIVGGYRAITGDIPIASSSVVGLSALPSVPFILLLRSFASGCSALTGIEAISNGIPLFRDPSQRNAKITMIWMSVILGGFFIGMTVLAHLFSIIPHEHETVVSLLSRKVFGESVLYYTVQFATALILLLAANTSYADFPRLASLIAKDRFLPRQLASLGDKLVFSNGILGLSLSAIVMIVLFGGETHHLIPLYAVGVFLSFTLSQTGMVAHHLKLKEFGWKKAMVINAVGALTTLTVLLVIATTKFSHGAWMIVLAIPLFVSFFWQIHKHYLISARQLAYVSDKAIDWTRHEKHVAIIPISGVHVGVTKAVKYGRSIATDVVACTVDLDHQATENLRKAWKEKVPDVELVVLESPYRSIFRPLVAYVDQIKNEHPDQFITIIIPEFITRRWYHQFLHNQTALFLYAYLRRKRGVVVTSVRYHLR